MKFKIKDYKMLFDGFLKIFSLRIQKENSEISREIVVTKNTVGALLYSGNSCYLVSQYRAPVFFRRSGLNPVIDGEYSVDSGNLIEIVAGEIEPGEDPDDAIIREIKEETGFIVTEEDLDYCGEYYLSPGRSTETMKLYLVEVDPSNKIDPIKEEGTTLIKTSFLTTSIDLKTQFLLDKLMTRKFLEDN